MAVPKRRKSDRSGRPKIYSPGRPPVAQKAHYRKFWNAIDRGLTSDEASRHAGISPAVGARLFRHNGGMKRKIESARSKRYLSFPEREEIAILHEQEISVRDIALKLRRSPSTVSRELRRNAATRSGDLKYRAHTAQWHADRRSRRPKLAKLNLNSRLRDYVEDRLSGKVKTINGRNLGPETTWIDRNQGRRKDRRWAKSWSPEQISNRLRIDYPQDESMRISPEAIYQSLYIQGRGNLKRELVACLRTGRALRIPRERSRRGSAFVNKEILISERPAEVEDRAIPGHWEGDLILGAGSSAIGTLVERTTRFTILLHLPRMENYGAPRNKRSPPLAGHGAEAVRKAIAASIIKLPKHLKRSLTWDQGTEMAQHEELRVQVNLPIYFCDPQFPWQRGTNENTNGLLRQYFPKGTDLSRHSKLDLDSVAATLNSRPRKTLEWKTPSEAFNDLLKSRRKHNVATTG